MEEVIEMIEKYINSAEKYEVKHMLIQIKNKLLDLDARNFNEIGMEQLLTRFKTKIMNWLDIDETLFEYKLKENQFTSTEKKFILFRMINEIYNAKN